jgi:3-deoxy-D-manno-octulosonate 8-phosphate phosphatase KdsC-like HAD superfamily phosphatase
MELSISSNSIAINGNIKSISDFQKIKQAVDGIITQHKSIVLNIIDSLSITSSVIGYLNKLVLKDNINIHMNVGNEQLLHLLDDLNLVSTFKAKKT